MEYIDTTNSNNHAGIARMEATEKVQSLLDMINKYRVELEMWETTKTLDVLMFLRELEKKITDEYKKELDNGELTRAREEYLLMFHKKPYMNWSIEEIRQKMEEGKAGEVSPESLTVKKSQWKKQMKK